MEYSTVQNQTNMHMKVQCLTNTDDISHQYFTMYQLKTKTFYKTIITSKTDNRCNSSFFLICSLCLNFSSCPHDISCCLSPGLNLMSCFSVSFNLKWLVFFSFVTLHIYLFGCARPQLWHVGPSIFIVACGIQFLNQGSNPGQLHWELGVLATGPLGKSL